MGWTAPTVDEMTSHDPAHATHQIIQDLVGLPVAELRVAARQWGAEALAAALELAATDGAWIRQVTVTQIGQP